MRTIFLLLVAAFVRRRSRRPLAAVRFQDRRTCFLWRNKRRYLVFAGLADVLSYQIGDVAKIDEKIGNVDKARSSVRAKTGDLDAAAFVGNGVDGVNEI